MIPQNAISPELVAAKLAQAENLDHQDLEQQIQEQPRLVEMLWFIQWMSCQPGGLGSLVLNLISAFPERFVTRAMQKAGPPKNGRYTIEQCLIAWKEECSGRWEMRPERDPGTNSFQEWLAFHYDAVLTPQRIERGINCSREKILEGVDCFNWPFLKECCEYSARCRLAEYLRDLCVEKSRCFDGPRYCPDLIKTLFDYMDLHAAQAGERLAETEVALKVTDALDYAWSERKLVRVDGNSRFGKTEAVKTWCAKYPGRARLVTVPCSNSEADMVRAVAEALGMVLPFGVCGPKVRAQIEFILRHGRLGWVFDESHFLFPVRYGPNTVPVRLNWLRTQIVDRRLPCALITTPQAYEGQRAKFDKATGYNMEQFTGRISLCVPLPETLGQQDLFAVARIHFPEFGGPQLKLIVGAAICSDSYLKAVEDIATRSRWLARRRGEAAVTLEDVKTAIGEVVPGAAQVLGGPSVGVVAETGNTPAEPSTHRRRKASAEVVRELRPGGRRTDFGVGELPKERTGEIVSTRQVVAA